MPLTAKGTEILSAMESEYGAKKGESVFYASKNAGKISGVDSAFPIAKRLENLAERRGDCTMDDDLKGGRNDSIGAMANSLVDACAKLDCMLDAAAKKDDHRVIGGVGFDLDEQMAQIQRGRTPSSDLYSDGKSKK